MEPLFEIPENLAALAAAELLAFVQATVARIREIGANPNEFTTQAGGAASLREQMQDAVDAIAEARAFIAEFEAEETPAEDEPTEALAEEPVVEDEPVEEPVTEAAELSDAEAAELAALAEGVTEPELTASAEPEPTVRRRAPGRSRAAAPRERTPQVALTAAAGADLPSGHVFPSMVEIAEAMIERRRGFGLIAEGDQDKVKIARAAWSQFYPESRDLVGKDQNTQEALVAAVTDPDVIRANFEARRREAEKGGSLVASGGLCAPVTPYYNLMMISQADRPVRASLPSFNADRGGLRYAAPASLASITTGVAAMTVAQDAAGGTTGTKSCQAVDCPSFSETDVEILYHCLKFGNLGARTFPERVAQWNSLVLAAHARLGERTLLTGIDTASTAVTAATLGLGAAADLPSQVLAAAAGYRSRHRMDPNAVLRVMFPKWVQALIVSDVYRSQFGRWDMTPDRFVSILRAANVEPTFYIDSAAGKSQEFGVQSAGALLSFPSTVTWYLFAEGSFLYLDGGTLELGLVRDSVLNSTNDFEIFGESFENVAFIGVESLAVTSTLCDSGITAGTHNPICPIDYTHTT